MPERGERNFFLTITKGCSTGKSIVFHGEQSISQESRVEGKFNMVKFLEGFTPYKKKDAEKYNKLDRKSVV